MDNEFGLLRCNLRTGEILDASGKVVGRVVPVEPTEEQYAAWQAAWTGRGNFFSRFRVRYAAMLSAATLDLEAAAVKVPDTHGFDGVFAAGMQHVIDALGVPK